MIRLPSFFKRKTHADDLDRGSVGRNTAKRTAPRAFQRAAEAEELALTEDPEQQRARHRLIGAAVLVLIAVVGLPRILDSRPKTAPNDIAVNIVTSLPIPGAETKPAETKVESKPEEKSKTESESSKPVTAVPAPAPDAKSDVKAEVKSASPNTPAPTKSSSLGLAAGEEVVAPQSNAKPKVEDPNKAATVNNPPASSGKFVIQIGAFASESNVNALVARLKSQKIPSYVLNKAGTDGNKTFLVRAGPYTDKDAAEAAEKKIKAMGLTPRIVETGKQ
ncbi:MAG: sporulation protein [Polynucleobacter sp.]|uniref:SPOR domain-containing protein n=1 Tax=Polynucleobacter sp. TaxID=2029855 RepID=UPI002173B16D|nr:SPOR domain-containing protein [Polynucleobacter sp.]MBU3669938.1 sporulation protein [Polynucleobacter sp.]